MSFLRTMRHAQISERGEFSSRVIQIAGNQESYRKNEVNEKIGEKRLRGSDIFLEEQNRFTHISYRKLRVLQLLTHTFIGVNNWNDVYASQSLCAK